MLHSWSYYQHCEQLPLTANGKVDKKQLQARFKRQEIEQTLSNEKTKQVAPRNKQEQLLADLFCQTLMLNSVGVHDDFFALGGTSLAAMKLLSMLKQQSTDQQQGIEISIKDLYQSPTIEQLAKKRNPDNDKIMSHNIEKWPANILPISTSKGDDSKQNTLFLVHQVMGSGLSYFPLRDHFTDRAIYAIESPRLSDPQLQHVPYALDSIAEMASYYITQITALQPIGPYSLGGHSLGGLVVFEMARQLELRGEKVADLIIMDTSPAYLASSSRIPDLQQARQEVVAMIRAFVTQTELDLTPAKTCEALEQQVLLSAELLEQHGVVSSGHGVDYLNAMITVYQENCTAALNYPEQLGQIQAYQGDITLIVTDTLLEYSQGDRHFGWSKLIQGHINTVKLPGDHYGLFQPPILEDLVKCIRRILV
jgi:thioesterase domain-containing protein/aryl carrier-like protein